MDYIAFICGVLVGILCLTRPGVINTIGVYFVFYKYRNKDKYYSYYDSFRQPIAQEMIEDQGLVYKFSDYLKILKKFRPIAYDDSIEIYEMFAHVVILRYLPFCLFSSLIFLFYWYLYIAGLLISAILEVLYLLIFNKSIFIYYKNAIFIYTINNIFIKARWPKESDRP